MEFLWIVVAALAGVAAGTLFSQRIKDWFAGVESDLRAKAVEAGKVVLGAAAAEEARIRLAARAAADKAIVGAKAAVTAEVLETVAPPPAAPAA